MNVKVRLSVFIKRRLILTGFLTNGAKPVTLMPLGD
jgi:hypothetical protein